MNRFLSIGTDIEVFALDKDNIHRSLCGKIGGTKDKPKQLKDMKKGFCVQEDNVALEYNVPATNTLEGWLDVNKSMQAKVKDILAELGYTISPNCSVTFDDEELTHPNALVFGCEPDYNAWTRTENPRPFTDNLNLRTAGGHIHVGTNADIAESVKQMDLYLGIPSILLDDTDSSRERRKLYGKSGALRPKPYGFEYRTLSNFWTYTDDLLKWAFVNTKRAILEPKPITAEFEDIIQTTINTGDKDAAKGIMSHFGLTTQLHT